MKNKWKFFGLPVLALLLGSVVGVADSTRMPPPGTLNYVEGQVSVEGQLQTPKSVGSTYLEPNQELNTGDGNAELLLTPGVYLRLGHNSSVKMVSPGLADTQVALTGGSAILEADTLFKENNVSVMVNGVTTRIEKAGLYGFSAVDSSVKVLDGKAVTFDDNQNLTLKKGSGAILNQPLTRRKFNSAQVEEDPLYRWSKLRSEYSTESNVSAGNALLAGGGWWGPGWYWDPFWYDFAFLPGDGMFWGPFGYPFFSPAWVGLAPYYGFYGGYGFYHYPVAGGRSGSTAKGRSELPPLAHHPVAGSPGFRALPRSAAGGRTSVPIGGFQGGSPGFHGSSGGLQGAFAGGSHGGGGRR